MSAQISWSLSVTEPFRALEETYPDIRRTDMSGGLEYRKNSDGGGIALGREVAKAILASPINLKPLYIWCKVNGLPLPVELRYIGYGVQAIRWEKE